MTGLEPLPEQGVDPGVPRFGDGRLVLIAGPCVVESRDLTLEVAAGLRSVCHALGVPLVFKASFDKANRTSSESFRSIGFEAALAVLADVRDAYALPVTTDVHEPWHVRPVSEVADLIQIPALLCRQTDLLAAAGSSGLTVNIKKGQFLAPEDMRFASDKARAAGAMQVLVTERGTTFGYRDLVVDLRGLVTMRTFAPVVFDATHSVQIPGGSGGRSGGRREFVGPLARAAVAVGVDALFLETHPDPDRALSDGPNMLALGEVDSLLRDCLALRAATEGCPR